MTLSVCLAALLSFPGRAAGEPVRCQRTIAKAGQQLLKATVRALQKCEDLRVKAVLPPGTICRRDAKTQTKIAKASSKLRVAIGKACGGGNRVCDATDSGADADESLASIGWASSACPGLTGASCGGPIVDCSDVASCLDCVVAAAAAQTIEPAYRALVSAEFGTNSPTNKCQRTIGKETARFAQRASKARQKCWDQRMKGKHADACPDATALAGSPAAKAAAVIDKAAAKREAKICRACGGVDRTCDGADPPPAAVGFADDCRDVTAPGGGSCAGAVTTMTDVVGCTGCVAAFGVVCADRIAVPQFAPYPDACRPATASPTPSSTVPTTTPTATSTPFAAATPTATNTPFATATPTATNTPFATATAGPPSATPTAPAPTTTPTSLETSTPSATPTGPAPSPTLTPAGVTPTATATSAGPTATETSTAAPPATATPTPTSIGPATATSTPTASSTAGVTTPTPSPTATSPVAALDRPADPVVLTGAALAALTGGAPGNVAAFRYAGGWVQIPVQIDERDVISFDDVYNGVGGHGGGITVLDYTDAGTFAGADADPTFDADDELVFMAGDAGGQPPGVSEPAGVVSGSGLELTITDPLGAGTGYVYLFAHAGTLDPAAGAQYVDYQFTLLSGDYLTTYDISKGPNPENSVVATSTYSRHFSDRWVTDELQIHAGAASGVDILDRHKNLFAPGQCIRSEDTFSRGEGAFVINKSGPVRAIRSYVGANSGPLTQRQHHYYERREDITTFLRVHAINAMLDFFDYSPAAAGMTYHSSVLPAGVTIDGVPDAVGAALPEWELVTGAQGSLVMTGGLESTAAITTVVTYYVDDLTPSDRQCTGDAFAYGSSGPFIAQEIPNTDPRNPPADSFTSVRTLYFEPPGTTVAEAATRSAWAASPLAVSVVPWP